MVKIKVISSGKLIKYNRMRRRITRLELSNELFCSIEQLNRIENHNLKPDNFTLKKIAEIFKMEVKDLIQYNPDLYQDEIERLYNARLAEDASKIIHSANSQTELAKKIGATNPSGINKFLSGKYKGDCLNGYIITQKEMFDTDERLKLRSGIYKLDKLIKNIEKWAKDRNLNTADPAGQINKLFEEGGELAKAYNKKNLDDIKDGIGDTIVVLTVLSMQLGIDIKDCVNLAYEEIKDRRGKLINGVFVKESDFKE